MPVRFADFVDKRGAAVSVQADIGILRNGRCRPPGDAATGTRQTSGLFQ